MRSERSCDVRVATWESRRCAKTQSHDVRVGMVRGGGDGGFLGLGFSFVLRSYFGLCQWCCHHDGFGMSKDTAEMPSKITSSDDE